MSRVPDKKWVLVPLLTGKEKEAAFVEKIRACGKIVLVFVADPARLGSATTTEAGERLRQAEQDFAELRKHFPEPTVVKEVLEWGPVAEKIESLARIEQVDEIVLADSLQSRQVAALLSAKGLRVSVL